MKTIYVLAEHRKQQLRDTTWETLSLAKKLAPELGAEVVTILLGSNIDEMATKLSQESPKVLTIDDPAFDHFNPDAVLLALPKILGGSDSFALLVGNSNQVLDIAPGLSVVLNAALATDCFSVDVLDGSLAAKRQVYNYKVNTDVSFKGAERVIITLRAGSFPYTLTGDAAGVIEKAASPISSDQVRRVFKDYVETEKGDVDIASADIIVSLGRGIGDEPEMDMFQSLADTMGGVLACSRPIVDKELLPKYHQVGTSGIEVKPKVYLALGISGAFQHVGGIKGSPLIIAVNKDAKAPIFRVAQYGVVADLNEIVPALEEKIQEIKG